MGGLCNSDCVDERIHLSMMVFMSPNRQWLGFIPFTFILYIK